MRQSLLLLAACPTVVGEAAKAAYPTRWLSGGAPGTLKRTYLRLRPNGMGTAQEEGELWGAKARVWAEKCERVCLPLWNAMLDASNVG